MIARDPLMKFSLLFILLDTQQLVSELMVQLGNRLKRVDDYGGSKTWGSLVLKVFLLGESMHGGQIAGLIGVGTV